MCYPKYKWTGSASNRTINTINLNEQHELNCVHEINNKYQVSSEKLFLTFYTWNNQQLITRATYVEKQLCQNLEKNPIRQSTTTRQFIDCNRQYRLSTKMCNIPPVVKQFLAVLCCKFLWNFFEPHKTLKNLTNFIRKSF